MLTKDKIYYFAHPCTTGNLTIVENRVIEESLYNQVLAVHGIKVLRPLQLIPETMGHREAMIRCFKLLEVSDIAVFAPNWEKSKGCKMEYDFCLETGKTILFINHLNEVVRDIRREIW
jgi:hypothetical protein